MSLTAMGRYILQELGFNNHVQHVAYPLRLRETKHGSNEARCLMQSAGLRCHAEQKKLHEKLKWFRKDNLARCSPPERLSVLLVNCRSIKNKVDNFMSLVATVKPQIVMDTESWLDKTIPNVEIFPPDFTLYRKDRHGHGGGVFFLISNALSSTQILFESNSESVWCPVKLHKGNNVVYRTLYHPPGSSDSFALLSEMLSFLPNSVFLGGDFNLPDFNGNAGCVAGNRSRIYTEFEELLGLNGLQQYVLEPTRENAILELVLCNEPNIISKVT
ncbi:uncharacterized protein LOC142588017 [Dermacentor variabilis]|uniref:uncharacterized protein LOC142588017 n=1 Tax=Dermacentor variabilis TaxID=34621 RepID=UPI003F5B0F62